MIRLLKIDFRKYFYSKTFWVLISVYLALIMLVFFSIEKLMNSVMVQAVQNAPMTMPDFSMYCFPLVCHNLAYVGGFF